MLILFIFVYPLLGGNLPKARMVDVPAAIGAGVTLLWAVAGYIKLNRSSNVFFAQIAYWFLALTVSLLVAQSGITSVYLALWLVVAFFAGALNSILSLAMLLVVVIYFVMQYFMGALNSQTCFVLIFGGIIPTILGLLVWYPSKRNSTEGDSESMHILTAHSGASKAQTSEFVSQGYTILNAIGDGIITINQQKIITFINQAAEELLGWSKEDAISLEYQSVIRLQTATNDTPEQSQDPIYQALNTRQQVRTSELKVQTKDDSLISVEVVASPATEVADGVIIVLRDITKQEAQAKERTEFISTASHEMRTPVASIEGYLGLALNPRTATIDDKARSYLTKAHESSQHLGRLFQDLLDVSKSEDGRMKNYPKIIEMTSFVGKVVESLHPKAAAKQLSLQYLPDATAGITKLHPILYSRLDPDHLREVVANLTDNAIKYTPSGGVQVNVTGDNEHVQISIKDSGLGIPSEDVPHLFQKFYRVDSSDTREIGGTGLGLYLCRRLVEGMQGRIWVESTYKKGSTFFVELPRLNSQEAQVELQQQTKPDQPTAAEPAPGADAQTKTPSAEPTTTPPAPVQQPTVLQPTPVSPTVQPPAPTTVTNNTPLSVVEAHPARYAPAFRDLPRPRPTAPPRNPPQNQ